MERGKEGRKELWGPARVKGRRVSGEGVYRVFKKRGGVAALEKEKTLKSPRVLRVNSFKMEDQWLMGFLTFLLTFFMFLFFCMINLRCWYMFMNLAPSILRHSPSFKRSCSWFLI